MKRILITSIVCMFLLGTATAGTKSKIAMRPSSYEDPIECGNSVGREMTWTPKVYSENNQLSFEASDSPIIIYVYRGDRMVYTQAVLDGSTSIELPEALKGELTLYMIYGDTIYYGEFSL